MQNGSAVASALKASSKAQTNFAQIEKEMLAIVFGCLRFHQFIYGKTTEIETDLKLLESIFKKPTGSVSPRIQQLHLKLQPYWLRVVHKPGKEMYVADTLSRVHLKTMDKSSEPDDKLEEEVEAQVHLVMSHLPVSENNIETFHKETRRDNTLMALKTMVTGGWPNERKAVPAGIKEYWNYRERCDVCQTRRNTQQKETLMPHKTPHRPWQILGVDLFS